MDRFVAAIHKASDYVYRSHWVFNPEPIEIKVSDSIEAARDTYNALVSDMVLKAAVEGTAIRAVVVDKDTDTVLECRMYSGEKVRFHYAAYEGARGKYIDQILADVTFYEAMWPQPEVRTVAIASTMEELEYQLGEEFKYYMLLT